MRQKRAFLVYFSMTACDIHGLDGLLTKVSTNCAAAVQFSPLLSANCASFVIASHSSRITSLNFALHKQCKLSMLVCLHACYQRVHAQQYLKIVRVLTKSWICWRTMPMPLSSEALSSSTIPPMLPPYICLATASIVEVLPVPGGPYSRR